MTGWWQSFRQEMTGDTGTAIVLLKRTGVTGRHKDTLRTSVKMPSNWMLDTLFPEEKNTFIFWDASASDQAFATFLNSKHFDSRSDLRFGWCDTLMGKRKYTCIRSCFYCCRSRDPHQLLQTYKYSQVKTYHKIENIDFNKQTFLLFRCRHKLRSIFDLERSGFLLGRLHERHTYLVVFFLIVLLWTFNMLTEACKSHDVAVGSLWELNCLPLDWMCGTPASGKLVIVMKAFLFVNNLTVERWHSNRLDTALWPFPESSAKILLWNYVWCRSRFAWCRRSRTPNCSNFSFYKNSQSFWWWTNLVLLISNTWLFITLNYFKKREGVVISPTWILTVILFIFGGKITIWSLCVLTVSWVYLFVLYIEDGLDYKCTIRALSNKHV